MRHYQKIIETYYQKASQQKAANETFKREHFLVLLSELFPNEREAVGKYVEGSETSVIVTTKASAGRIDAYFGNLVIEFERDLTAKAKFEEGTWQLKEYISGLWNKEGRSRRPYIGIVTDGLRWVSYHPRPRKASGTLDPADIELFPKEDFTLANTEESTLDFFYLFLDRYFFRENLLKPTTDAFKNDFGLSSGLWYDLEEALEKAFEKHKRDSEISVAFEQWGKYLQYTYGSVDAGFDLFLRHSYLSVLARFLVATALWPKEAAAGGFPYIHGVVSGSYFSSKNILNLADEDFFHWLGREAVLEELDATWLRVLNQLKTYDFSLLDEDILKGVYQELVDPKDRHDLGEYYTPDWLCERVVEKLFEEASTVIEKGRIPSFLDPTCGSGSFLRAGLKKILSIAREKYGAAANWDAILEAALSNVIGVDINPLAVIISKANYVLALKDELSHKKRPAIIPVFLADSLFMPLEEEETQQDSFAFDSSNVELTFLSERYLLPRAVFQKAQIYDDLILLAAEAAVALAVDPEAESIGGILKALKRIAPSLVDVTLDQAANACLALSKAMAQKIRDRENHIWSFILRNTYRPAFFRKRFDIVAGNPPWLSYRYIADPAYQARIKELALTRYTLAPKNQALNTHMELATVFFVHTAATYLSKKGRIGFVMPRSIFSADQHERFRAESWDAECSVKCYWDLKGVKPLFNVPSCVVFGEARVAKEKKSYPAVFYEGDMKGFRNLPWSRAKSYLAWEEGKLYRLSLGKKTALSRERGAPSLGSDADEGGKKGSYYRDKFYQGASIFPRNIYFITTPTETELSKDELYIRTDTEQAKEAKEPWKPMLFEGRIERELIFRSALSKDILPFCVEPDMPYITLPLIRERTSIGEGCFELTDAEGLKKAGYRTGAEWYGKAERVWEAHRGAKTKATLEEWLDYSSKLSKQFSNKRYMVLYNASGTNISAACLDTADMVPFFADGKTYWYSTGSEKEANYLVGILNSAAVNDVIKPFQSTGSLGERDIHKVPLELPFPQFDPKSALHGNIAEQAKEAARLVQAAQRAGTLTGSLRKRRSVAREVAVLPLNSINELVKKLLSNSKKNGE